MIISIFKNITRFLTPGQLKMEVGLVFRPIKTRKPGKAPVSQKIKMKFAVWYAARSQKMKRTGAAGRWQKKSE